MNNILNYKQGDKKVISMDDIVSVNSLIGGCTAHNGISGRVSRLPTLDNPLVSITLPDGETKLAFDSCELVCFIRHQE